jgi:hypothetical protein
VAFCTLQSLDRSVEFAALFLKLLDDFAGSHAGMVTLGAFIVEEIALAPIF